jgi:hypothetical protein
MRTINLFGRSIVGVAAAAALVGGAVASCTFSPGPAGSTAGGPAAPDQPGTNMPSNPFGGSSGAAASGGTVQNPNGTPASIDGKNCGLQQYGLQALPPDLLLVLDRSGSMSNGYDDVSCTDPTKMPMQPCTPKWPDMIKGLNMVIGDTTATIRWGLKYFPDDDEASSCNVGAAAAIAPAANSGAMVTPLLATAQPNTNMGRTPTAAAITRGAAYLMTLTDPNPKYILLATDGLPNCGAKNSGNDAGAGAAVLAAAMAGIPTYVIGIGNVKSAIAALNTMADNGGRPRMSMTDPATHYYPVGSTADLVSILTAIGGQIASCTFTLGKAPPDPTNIAVYGDMVRLPQDKTHASGWDYGAGMTSVELFGATCEAVKAKQIKTVQAVFGCPGEKIP